MAVLNIKIDLIISLYDELSIIRFGPTPAPQPLWYINGTDVQFFLDPAQTAGRSPLFQT